jgi:FKBP-type peptidyl-prolyl cis-trans isomerase
MKLKQSIALCAVSVGLVAGRAQDVKFSLPGQGDNAAANAPAASNAPATSAPAAPAKASFNETQIAEEVGWIQGKNMGLFELEFNKAELDALIKGLQAAAAGKDSPYELNAIGPVLQEFMQKKQTSYFGKLKEKNAAENAAFFTKLKDNKKVVQLPDGLCYEVLKQGDGAFPKPTDVVKIHYTGSLVNGTVFDSSVERGQPLEMPVNQFVPGFTEGLQKINKGGKIKMYIPPQLGYGDEPKGEIPPGSALVFEVELLDVNPAGAQPAAATPPAAK